MQKILPLKPYNKVWIDCVYNNLIGVLSYYDDSFEVYPLLLENTYVLEELITDKIPYENLIRWEEKRINLGWNILHVRTSKFEIRDYFQHDVLALDSLVGLHEIIKERISEGYYVLLGLDRFYFPGSTEHNSTHYIHPCFIYGFDDSCYYLMEDYRVGKHLENYSLLFEHFDNSLSHILDDEVPHEINFLKIKQEIQFPFQINQYKEILLGNLDRLLTDDEIIGRDNWTLYKRGLSRIYEYSDHLHEVLVKLPKNCNPARLRFSEPAKLQEKNLVLLNYLESVFPEYSSDFRELKVQYEGLWRKWQIINSKLQIFSEKKTRGIAIDLNNSVSKTQSLLKSVYEDEISLTQTFKNLMTNI